MLVRDYQGKIGSTDRGSAGSGLHTLPTVCHARQDEPRGISTLYHYGVAKLAFLVVLVLRRGK